jgi:hypothetical protein
MHIQQTVAGGRPMTASILLSISQAFLPSVQNAIKIFIFLLSMMGYFWTSSIKISLVGTTKVQIFCSIVRQLGGGGVTSRRCHYLVCMASSGRMIDK